MAASDWVNVTAAVVPAIAVLTSLYVARFSISAQQKTSGAAISAQRDLAVDERLWAQRATLYVELLQWAVAVRATNHVDREECERVERIPPDVAARAAAFASEDVEKKLAEMARLRDLDALSFKARHEVQVPNEVVVSWRRSGHLRRMAKELQELIRRELGSSD